MKAEFFWLNERLHNLTPFDMHPNKNNPKPN